jgi:hypothetical protein
MKRFSKSPALFTEFAIPSDERFPIYPEDAKTVQRFQKIIWFARSSPDSTGLPPSDTGFGKASR